MGFLNRKVLVLNKSWFPIKVASVRRCLKLVFADKASIVDTNDFSIFNWEKWEKIDASQDKEKIITTRGFIRIPEVIVLSKYDKVINNKAKLTKKNLYLRDKFTCQYTNKKLSVKDADIDHIIPKSKGGGNTWDNLVVCSKEVNRKKADKTLEESGLNLIKKPSRPSSIKLMIEHDNNIPESWSKFIKDFI